MKLPILFLLYISLSNIPEPGILLHGMLRDDRCLLQEEQPLKWSFIPVAGGDTLHLKCKVESIDTVNALYRYKVLIPLATDIEGCPSPANSLLVQEHRAAYIRQLSIEGSDLLKRDTVYLSKSDRGTFRMWNMVW